MRNDVRMFMRGVVIAVLLFDLNKEAPSTFLVICGWIYLIDCFFQILIWIAEYFGITTESLKDKND